MLEKLLLQKEEIKQINILKTKDVVVVIYFATVIPLYSDKKKHFQINHSSPFSEDSYTLILEPQIPQLSLHSNK